MRLLYKTSLFAFVLFLATLAPAATPPDEPSLQQVYQAAQAGRLQEAQQMMDQVLQAHPRSAKAHYVRAELLARQGSLAQAREELRSAEALAPGLPFARPEALASLRRQLSLADRATVPALAAPPAPVPASSAPIWPWLLLAGGGALLALLLARRRAVPALPAAVPGGLGGAQTMGRADPVPAYGAPYGGGAYGGYGAAQPADSLGSRLAGGLATGVAVGAGIVAAEAIGRHVLGDAPRAAGTGYAAQTGGFEPVFANADMGGQDFGVRDASSWDDAGSDWDN